MTTTSIFLALVGMAEETVMKLLDCIMYDMRQHSNSINSGLLFLVCDMKPSFHLILIPQCGFLFQSQYTSIFHILPVCFSHSILLINLNWQLIILGATCLKAITMLFNTSLQETRVSYHSSVDACTCLHVLSFLFL